MLSTLPFGSVAHQLSLSLLLAVLPLSAISTLAAADAAATAPGPPPPPKPNGAPPPSLLVRRSVVESTKFDQRAISGEHNLDVPRRRARAGFNCPGWIPGKECPGWAPRSDQKAGFRCDPCVHGGRPLPPRPRRLTPD